MRSLLFLFIFPFNGLLFAQQPMRPSLALQSGFTTSAEVYFQFSASNKYLWAYSIMGECILWEVSSGRQLKHIMPVTVVDPELIYLPRPDLSPDERYWLIPQSGKGNYFLYDILADSIVHIFHPLRSGDKFTHAFFSGDSKNVMFVVQSPGDKASIELEMTDLAEVNPRFWLLDMPDLVMKFDFVVKLLIGRRNLQGLEKVATLQNAVPSPGFDKIWFSGLGPGIYCLDMSTTPPRLLTQQDCRKIDWPGSSAPEKLSWYNGKVLALGRTNLESIAGGAVRKLDTLLVIDPVTQQLEKKIPASFIVSDANNRSNGLVTPPLTASNSLNAWFETQPLPGNNFEVTGHDLFSGRTIFSYQKGITFYQTLQEEYRPGTLNGGYITAVSDDQTLMAECSREIVIHDLSKKTIRSVFSPNKGDFRINAPVYLDSFRMLIPKLGNDGFVLNMRTGHVERLDRSIACFDTARAGANNYYEMDITAPIGIQNANARTADRTFTLVNYATYDLCQTPGAKTLQVWSSDSLRKLEEYHFQDREFSYYVSALPGVKKTFLVNYKLISFAPDGTPAVKELKVIQKKDTFIAVNPFFLPASHTIVAVMATRIAPGNPDILFGEFDLQGKLLRSSVYHRKKSKLAFQSFLWEAQLSPDSTHLLFALHDGTVAVVRLSDFKVVHASEHGTGVDAGKNIHEHVSILAGCFLDQRQFVTAGSDGQLLVWNIGEDKPVRTLSDEPILFYSLALSPDRRFLVGTDADKAIRFIDWRTGRTVLRFAAFNEDDYALVDADGYYFANRRGANALSFLYGGSSYEFSQFDLSLNRPDKVLSKMGYSPPELIGYYTKAWEKRVKLMGWDPARFTTISSFAAPSVHLSNVPTDLHDIATPNISFQVNATDYVSPLSRLLVSINGVPLYGVKGLTLKQGQNHLSIPVTIPLSAGDNRIAVSIVNVLGNESIRENLRVGHRAPAVKPDLYIVAIGTGKFAHPNHDLKYPVKDAQDVTTLFKSQSGRFGKINTILLQDAQVTRQSVRTLRGQLTKTRPDDMVILFFAGHGLRDKELNYYLSTYGCDFDHPSTASLPYDELVSLLDSIPARQKLMLLDACNSGELDKESVLAHQQGNTLPGEPVTRAGGTSPNLTEIQGPENPFRLMLSLFTDLRPSNGTSIIAASSAVEPAAEGDQWNNGVFTHCLLEGLKGKKADINKDGKIMLSELLEYIQTNVVKLTDGKQQPVSRAENIVNDLVIWE
ncbi:MAG: caspase family protein [Chitinophagaceae bacterium]|nr:caspase family protein [Chitinophagaceae bacterium]